MSTHSRQWRCGDWFVTQELPGCCVVVDAALTIRATRSSSESTGDVEIKFLMWPHRKKSIGVRSGDLVDQARGQPLSVQRSMQVAVSCSRTCRTMWAAAPSCWNHMFLLSANGISLQHFWWLFLQRHTVNLWFWLLYRAFCMNLLIITNKCTILRLKLHK